MAKNKLRQIKHELLFDKQNDFAEFLGISQSMYNKYERHTAQPSLDVALRIAKKLNKKVEDIFYLEDP